MNYELKTPELLEIACPTGDSVMGGSQKWYPGRWERAAGCGPTTASNLIWYLARSRPELRMLYDAGSATKERFVELMRELYRSMPPGIGGVNKPVIFTDGITRFCDARGLALAPHVLEVSSKLPERPDTHCVSEFIITALQSDSPVGFLNLDSGTVKNLETWHWVTIIGFDAESISATIIDKGQKQVISLNEWLITSRRGGAMVYLTGRTSE